MAKLIYVANISLDGFIEDSDGGFEWTQPSDEVFGFITELVRPVGTFLYGRRMYETMRVWETNQQLANQSKLFEQFAEIWKAADKVVYSGSLEQCVTKNTRIERQFDPVEVRQMKDSATLDLTISGATLAAHGIDHGLVDETHLLIYPTVVGSGKHVLPLTVRRELELIEQRSFTNGVVYVRYRHLT